LCLEEIAFAEARGDSACDATSTTVAIANKLRRDSKFIPLLLDLSPRTNRALGSATNSFFGRDLLVYSSSRFRPMVSIHIMESLNAPASTLGEVEVRRCARQSFGSPKIVAVIRAYCEAIVLP